MFHSVFFLSTFRSTLLQLHYMKCYFFVYKCLLSWLLFLQGLTNLATFKLFLLLSVKFCNIYNSEYIISLVTNLFFILFLGCSLLQGSPQRANSIVLHHMPFLMQPELRPAASGWWRCSAVHWAPAASYAFFLKSSMWAASSRSVIMLQLSIF